ncbi:putative translocation protein Sec62 [Gregarina niphandrodes]|uniref:Translocation protein SEC62 n=1 Tax=Gregarina niphandrodes TaxID=110365 RepID=A0A023B1T8_GRENI|nr:putative translocation protein Sec62 [Gregarina niphandrodes]EZG48224.1 putative translocation protein Sec62 [Gregarina niphandrodes]|eukprot:XP_011132120.1 putative translocation protein Sec62 [Gregarina niphandrodes]
MASGCCSSSNRHRDSNWDKDAEAFLNDVLKSLKTREAVEVGTKAVEYFRGIDYMKHINEHKSEILKRHECLCLRVGIDLNGEAVAIASALGQLLVQSGLIAKTDHAPLPNLDQSQIPAHLRDNSKWPRRVKIARDQTFTPDGFYAINYEAQNAYSLALLGGTIAVVLIFCMFPIWPFGAKIATWYLTVVLLTILLFCVVIRLVLFVGLWFCGRDFWFLPNLFDEDAGVIESFQPLYSYKQRDDDWLMVAVRAFAAVLTAASFYKLSETHSLSDVTEAGVGAFIDILEWGHTKLGGNSTEVTTNANLDAFLSPEERLARHWEICVKHCEFQDTEEFMEFCVNDCNCLNEMWQSRCWRACEYDVRDELKANVKLCKEGRHSSQLNPPPTAENNASPDKGDEQEMAEQEMAEQEMAEQEMAEQEMAPVNNIDMGNNEL